MKLFIKSLKKRLLGKPLNSTTEIRLTRLCSQRCRQCRVYERQTDPPTMTWEMFQQIWDRLQEYGVYIGFISGGEPLLVPHLDRVLLASKDLFSLSTTLVTGLYAKERLVRKFCDIALDNHIHIQTSLDGLDSLGDYLRGANDFSKTVLGNMELIAKQKNHSKSLLYANIVMNNLNLDQVPDLINRIHDVGWKATIGVYHTITDTTRRDSELILCDGERLDRIIAYLIDHPDILNLNQFIRGIPNFIRTQKNITCAFTDSPFLCTRTTIMEDGYVHLCYGKPVGNILHQSFQEIFDSMAYYSLLAEYRLCNGCWTTCYTQPYLLVHPRAIRELVYNIKKVKNLK